MIFLKSIKNFFYHSPFLKRNLNYITFLLFSIAVTSCTLFSLSENQNLNSNNLNFKVDGTWLDDVSSEKIVPNDIRKPDSEPIATIPGQYEPNRQRNVNPILKHCWYGGLRVVGCFTPNPVAAFDSEISIFKNSACQGGWCVDCQANTCVPTRDDQITCSGSSKFCYIPQFDTGPGNVTCGQCNQNVITYQKTPQNTCPENADLKGTNQCVCKAGFEADESRSFCKRIVLKEASCPTTFPVLVGTGVKALAEVDYQIQTDHEFSLVRSYLSQRTYAQSNSRLGTLVYGTALNRPASDGGWHHNFAASLEFGYDQGVLVAVLVTPAGEVRLFKKVGTEWLSDSNDKLTFQVDSQNAIVAYRIIESAAEKIYYFNGSRNLLQLTDQLNRSYRFTYDVRNRVISVSNHFGFVMNFEYADDGTLRKVKFPSGSFVSYDYDSRGNLTKVTYPDRKSTLYDYEDSNLPSKLTAVKDSTGVPHLTISYYANGQVREVKTKQGDLENFRYTNFSTFVTSIDKKQNSSVAEFIYYNKTLEKTADGNPIIEHGNRNGTLSPLEVKGETQFCSLGSGTVRTFYSNPSTQGGSNPIKEMTKDGVKWKSYDANGNLLSVAFYNANHKLSSIQPNLNLATSYMTFSYVKNVKNVTKISRVTGPNLVRFFEYSPIDGQLFKESTLQTEDKIGTKSLTNEQLQVARNQFGIYFKTWTRNASGLVSKLTEGKNEIATSSFTYTYNNRGQVISVKDDLLNEVSLPGPVTYDLDGYLLSYKFADSPLIRHRYLSGGVLVERSTLNDDGSEAVIEYGWSAVDKQLESIRSFNRRLTTVLIPGTGSVPPVYRVEQRIEPKSLTRFTYQGSYLSSIVVDGVTFNGVAQLESPLKKQSRNVAQIILPPNAIPAGSIAIGGARLPSSSGPDLSPAAILESKGTIPRPVSSWADREVKGLADILQDEICKDDCKSFDKPTVTVKTLNHLRARDHLEFSRIPTGRNRKGWFMGAVGNNPFSLQAIVDKAWTENIGKTPSNDKESNYFLNESTDNLIIRTTAAKPDDRPAIGAAGDKSQPTNCVEIVVARKCYVHPLLNMLPTFLKNVPGVKYYINEVVTMYPVPSARCK